MRTKRQGTGDCLELTFCFPCFENTLSPRLFFTKNLQGDILNIYTEAGVKVASYTYDAWGNHTVTNHTSANIGNINPFRYRGYYYDVETNFYYLNSRYYDPQVKRFISADSISYLGANGDLQGYNLYAYCSNNPVMYVDNNGNSWSSFWKSVRIWFSNTFGAYVDLSHNVASFSEDYFFAGYESGTKIGGILGDDSKPISVFATNASEWWKFWEYQVGYKGNIGDFSCSYSIGIGETNSSIGWKDTSLKLQTGINKVGLGLSSTSNNVTPYLQYYIRTIPTAAVVLVMIYAPQLLGAPSRLVGIG